MGRSVIEINGTRYDASTGRVVNDVPVQPTVVKPTGHAIDGIMQPSTKVQALAPKPRVAPSLQKARVRDINMVHPAKPHKAKTLMRSAVKKPHTAPKPHTDAHPHLQLSPSYTTATQSNRLHQAAAVPMHRQVSRFADVSSGNAKLQPKVVGNLPVATHTPATPHHAVAKPHHAPPVTKPSVQFVNNQLAKSSEPAVSTPKKRAVHKRLASKLKPKKVKSVAMGSLAVLLIGGFLVYQNLPTISLAFANRQAGISAKLPEGVPSSFAIDKVAGSPGGMVALTYDSRVDDREFTLIQVKADTTIKSLEESVSRTSDNQYQTYQAGGITLFISPNDRVDWIDGEMRYNITGNTGFSPDQLAQIATSL